MWMCKSYAGVKSVKTVWVYKPAPVTQFLYKKVHRKKKENIALYLKFTQ